MEPLSELAQYGSAGVALGALGLVAWVINKMLTSLIPTIEKNTEVTQEMATYLKLRNGALDHALNELTEAQEKGQKVLKANTSLLKQLKISKER